MQDNCRKRPRGRELRAFHEGNFQLGDLKMPTPSALCKLFCSCGTSEKLAAAVSIVEVLSVRAYSLSPSRSMMSAGGNCENKKKALPLKGTEAFTSLSPRVTLLLRQILELNFPVWMIRPFL